MEHPTKKTQKKTILTPQYRVVTWWELLATLSRYFCLLWWFFSPKVISNDPAKHSFESPKRSLLLFFLDGTKQLLSSGFLHITNITFSVLISTDESSKQGMDECGLYLTSFTVDLSLGLLLCYGLMHLLNKFLSYKKSKKLKSGNYFKTDHDAEGKVVVSIDYWVWAEQTMIWLLVVFVVASCPHPDENNRNSLPGSSLALCGRTGQSSYGDVSFANF